MATSPHWPSSLKDPSKLCFESSRTRRLVLGSYWAVVLLALPLWWYTTSIERLSLPSSRVLGLFERHLRFQLHLQLDTEGCGDAAVVAKDWQGIFDQKAALEERWEGLDVYVHPKMHGGNTSGHVMVAMELTNINGTKISQTVLGRIPSMWGHTKSQRRIDTSPLRGMSQMTLVGFVSLSEGNIMMSLSISLQVDRYLVGHTGPLRPI